jgi:hypothetical protein
MLVTSSPKRSRSAQLSFRRLAIAVQDTRIADFDEGTQLDTEMR